MTQNLVTLPGVVNTNTTVACRIPLDRHIDILGMQGEEISVVFGISLAKTLWVKGCLPVLYYSALCSKRFRI